MKIDHIGYVTSNFKKTLEYFRDFIGLKVITKKILEPAHGVEVLFLEMGNNGYPAMEIIRPINNNSKISNFLNNNGEGIHHIAYEVDDIKKKILHFKKKNSIILTDIVPGAGHNKTPTVWLYTPQAELIELIEKQKNKIGLSRFTRK